jgi:hypothetical protein
MILLLILQQISAAASEQTTDSPGNAGVESAANHSYYYSADPKELHLPAGRDRMIGWLRSATAMGEGRENAHQRLLSLTEVQ